MFVVGFLDVFYVGGTCQTPDRLPKHLHVLRTKLPVKTIFANFPSKLPQNSH